MKHIWIFLLVLSFLDSSFSHAYNYYDQEKIGYSSDTARVNLLNGVAQRFVYTNTDSTIFYANQALKLAKTIDFDKGAAQANLLIATGNLYSGRYNEAEETAITALRIFKELNLLNEMADVLVKIGTIKMYRAEYDSAEIDLREALTIFESKGNILGQAKSYNVLGNIHQKRGNYPQASEYLHKALQQYEEEGNTGGAADALNNLGIIYEIQEEFDRALENYNGAYLVYKKLGDKLGVAIGLHNAGIILKKTGRLDSALYNFHRAKQIDEEIGSVDGVAYDEKEIGETYVLLGFLDSAHYYFSHSLLLAKELKDPVVIVPAIIGLGNIAKIKGDFDSAEKQLLRAYEMAVEYELQNEQKDAAQLLYEINNDLKNYKVALKYHQLYHSVKDTIFNLQNAKRLAHAEANFKFEKERAKTNYLDEINKSENDKIVSNAIWIRNTSFSVGIIITIIAAFIFFNYRQKKKDNRMLIVLNEEVESQRNELSTQAEELHALNESLNVLNLTLENKVKSRTKSIEEKNIELAINNKQLEAKNKKLANYAFYNAHKLRAPVASILGLVDLFLNSKVSSSEKEEIIIKIRKSTSSLNIVVREIQQILEEE